MTNIYLVIGFFTVFMCAMALAASYFEAKEKSKNASKNTDQ